MRKIILSLLCLCSGLSSFAQSVTTLHDGIELGDSTKLSWYGLFSSARFISKGTSSFSLLFQNKNQYTFSQINNTLDYTDFNAAKLLKISSSNFFEDYRNQLILPHNNDTTAIIESIGKPYSLLDFRANSGVGGATLAGKSLGSIYGTQGWTSLYPSSFAINATERLELKHNHSLRIWEGNTLRLQQVGDKIGINPLPVLNSYFEPLANLDVNGNIRSSVLAGTGKRTVLADENGVLEAGIHTEILSFPSFSLTNTSTSTELISSINGRYINSTSTNAIMVLPLQIPQGAKIVKIEMDYFDNTADKNMLVSFWGSGQSSNNNFLEFYTLGASSAMRTSIYNMQYVVDNQILSFYLTFRAINGINTSSTSWPGSALAVKNLRVFYEN